MLVESKRSFAMATSIVTLGMVHAAFAVVSGNGIVPIEVAGNITAAVIIQVCNLPNVVSPSPVALGTNTLAPVNTPDQIISADMNYAVNLTVTQKNPTRINYEDVSPVPDFPLGTPFPNPPPDPITGDQFRGTRGTEAVAVTSGNTTNVYCGDAVFRDEQLGPPGNNASSITFWWVAGPCGLDPASLAVVCGEYNTPVVTAAFVRATQDVDDSPVNACGCTQTLQLCNDVLDATGSASGNVVFCDLDPVVDFQVEGVIIGNSPACPKIGGKTYC